jgi:hypothetical protein
MPVLGGLDTRDAGACGRRRVYEFGDLPHATATRGLAHGVGGGFGAIAQS